MGDAFQHGVCLPKLGNQVTDGFAYSICVGIPNPDHSGRLKGQHQNLAHLPKVPIVISRVSFAGGFIESDKRKRSINNASVWVEF